MQPITHFCCHAPDTVGLPSSRCCCFSLCEDSELECPPAARRCPEAPRGQQPSRIHCLLDLNLTCELLAGGCGTELPTLLRDTMRNETERIVGAKHQVTSLRAYRRYYCSSRGLAKFKQKFCLKNMVTCSAYRRGVCYNDATMNSFYK
jgi:hypothetical protein